MLSLRTKIIIAGSIGWLLAVAAAVALALGIAHHTPATTRGFGGVPGGGFVPPTKLGGGGGGGGGGDITGVTAGTGLTGGATSGNATLNVDTTTIQARVPTSCSAGSFYSAISSGGTATCTAEPGDIAGVTAGTSLSGGGTSGTVTLNVNLPGASCSAGNTVTAISAGGTGTCSTFVNAAGTGLSLAGSTLSANLAGGTCSVGKVVTAVSSSGTATCTAPTVNNYADTHLEWVDEWMFDTCTSNSPCGSFYTLESSGTGAGYTFTTATTRPGIGGLMAGSTTTGRSALRGAGGAIDFGSGNWTFNFTGGVSALSISTDEYTVIAGFADTVNVVDQVDGCYVLYDRGNVATGGPNVGNADKLSCWCSSGSTRTKYLMDGSTVSDNSFTTVNAPVAAFTAPNTNTLAVDVVVTGTTKAEFYVSGVKSCEIDTNIPSTATHITGGLVQILKSAGTTSRTLFFDRIRNAVDLTSARSP